MPVSPARAEDTLRAIGFAGGELEIVTAPGEMGEREARGKPHGRGDQRRLLRDAPRGDRTRALARALPVAVRVAQPHASSAASR